MRSPLPRAVLHRLETGRLVVLSVLLGALAVQYVADGVLELLRGGLKTG